MTDPGHFVWPRIKLTNVWFLNLPLDYWIRVYCGSVDTVTSRSSRVMFNNGITALRVVLYNDIAGVVITVRFQLLSYYLFVGVCGLNNYGNWFGGYILVGGWFERKIVIALI